MDCMTLPHGGVGDFRASETTQSRPRRHRRSPAERLDPHRGR